MAEVHRDRFVAGQYFLAVNGVAAMRRVLSRPSEGQARVDDMKQIVAGFDEFPNDIEIEVVEHEVGSGYETWAPIYDGPNPAILVEAPVVHEMLAAIAPGRALDAACGTGRHAGHLDATGFDTVGVDATPAMLDVARSSFPEVEFLEGRLEALPVGDDSFDVVTSALAVCHAPDLDEVFSEFARVLKPGGTLILSDPHPTAVQMGGVAGFRDPDADPAEGFTMPFIPNLHHPIHTYVNAAVGAGFEIVECREPTFPDEGMATNPAYAVHPDAVRQAFDDLPFIIVWRMRKSS